MKVTIDGFEIEGTQDELIDMIVKVREAELKRQEGHRVPWTGQTPIHVIPYFIPPYQPWPVWVCDPWQDTKITMGQTSGDVRLSSVLVSL